MRRRERPAAARVGRALAEVASIPNRLDERVRPFAAAVGWAGVAALAGCAWLAATPDPSWPFGLVRTRMPVYTTISLVAASLLGWAFMQEGQARIERRVGRRLGFALFVALPLATAAVSLLEDHAPLRPEARADWAPLFVFARWYTPAAVTASLAAFLAATHRGTRRRAAIRTIAHAALVVPYAALLGALVFGFRFPWIDASLHETVRALGGGAVALQIVLAWFVGGTG